MNLGCNLATFGAVSRAARTARIVTDAIAIIRRETGQVAPCVKPTIVLGSQGHEISASNRRSELVSGVTRRYSASLRETFR